MFIKKEDALIYKYDSETVIVEAWGKNAVRIRATKEALMPDIPNALSETDKYECLVIEDADNDGMIAKNDKIHVILSKGGRITVKNNKGKTMFRELSRNRRDVTNPDCSALEIEAREFRPNIGGKYHLTYRFKAYEKEKIYGMGQYQQPYLNIKGMDFELAHRNSQASIPFFISSEGYGILWNNPAVGRAVFGINQTTFEAYATSLLDIWVVVGDTPKDLVEAYSSVTGKVPMMPEYGLGYWQCKLRYQTQEELLEVAREHKLRRNLPLDVIVADFFHWPKQGEWKFDKTYWPDPEAMVKELKDMNVELMVSIWPTVDKESENFEEMVEKGYLIRTERGVRVGLDFEGNTIHVDVTNPEAREYFWSKAKQNYYDYGIKIFWLDEAEPENAVYDFDNYRYYSGTVLETGNIYPRDYAKAFFEGMKQEGMENVVNLLRCAWAGSQKYGALCWSGDIASSFESMRNQFAAGLHMGIAGIPWWTTDIGGFHGGNPDDPAFRELFARWFAWGCFCPVMRLHGDREPRQPQYGTTGGAHCCSGAANEVWSYGDEIYEICVKYIHLREKLRDYTRELMKEAHESGTPVIRTMFYEFPEDERCWDTEEQYMYGDKYLVAPVMYAGVNERKVYLPTGAKWVNLDTNEIFDGGQNVTVKAPLNIIPVFTRMNV